MKENSPLGSVILTPFKLIRRGWRSITVEGAKKVAYLSVAIFVLLGVYNIQQQRANSRINRQVLYSIQDQTSPEAVAKRQAAVDDIIDIVDCKNQAALQRVIDVLVEREVLKPGDAKAITDSCESFLKAHN